MKNEFINDAGFFIRDVALNICGEITDESLVYSTLHFALGMERILKGILYSINPVYVYKTQDFKNSVSLLYKDKLLPGARHNKEIQSEPDGDVLTFKLSLIRSAALSEATEKHKNTLFALSNFRDIIAHNTLSNFKFEEAKTLLLGSFYNVIHDFSKEINIPMNFFIDSNEIKLMSISAPYQTDIEDRVRLKIESHSKRWKGLKEIVGYKEKMKLKTESLLLQKEIMAIDCPACNNDAVVKILPEYDLVDRESIIVGFFIDNLKCHFCKLELDDYAEIDFLGLQRQLLDVPDNED